MPTKSQSQALMVQEKHLTPEQMEQQEHFSAERLRKLVPDPKRKLEISEQPKANFQEIMNWAEANFSGVLKDKENLQRFVHNRIIIDGQFMQFCEEQKITIECLYRTSNISWASEHNFEKFFSQGAFLIKSKGVEFLHFCTWAKGTNYDDELSFFVIASEKNFEGYCKLRNDFDKWIQERDRSNLYVRVIEGDDIPYTKDNSWEDLFLPQTLKDEVRGLVENFLASKDFYLKNKIPWKRGVLFFGKPGNGKSSAIKTIISSYNFKPVTVCAGANNEIIKEAFSYAEDHSPALLYLEDLDSLMESIDTSAFLNLMDGIAAKNGLLVIATANNVKKLKTNITDRPSRFDRKFEVPLPDADLCFKYLKKWFNTFITTKQCKDISKFAVQHQFSYAYLKELYISAMFEALSHKRQSPSEKDIQHALDQLIKDKNALNGNDSAVNLDSYLSR